MPAKFLLLQVRDSNDPMLAQEVDCFSQMLGCDREQIDVWDLIAAAPTVSRLRQADVILLGGSGDYSVAEGGSWLPGALEAMRELVDLNLPTFASCWGFQAMARALGGEVVTDLGRAELGSLELQRTDLAADDGLFASLPPVFLAQMGHQDIVDTLPPGVVHLACSERVKNQAFRVVGKPIYGTQFHPELNRKALIERIINYPQYVQKIAGMTVEEFQEHCRETPESNALLKRFAAMVLE